MATVLEQRVVNDERAYSAVHRVPGPPIVRAFDTKRMVEHLVQEVAHELFGIGRTDPAGLIITVAAEELPDGSTNYVVSGSLPQDGPLSAQQG